MLHVLWITLILNSIFISKQVSYSNVKTRTSLRKNPKTRLYTPLIHKIGNFKNQLRKYRTNYRKVGIDDFGYEDISEPLQYNYKDVWWTQNYTDPTIKARKTTKNNVFHKDLTKNTTETMKPDKHSTIISTTKVTVKDNLRIGKNITKLLTKTAEKGLVNQTKVNRQPSSKPVKRTTKTERPFTKFVDKEKGFFLPVFSKDDKGPFSILSNQTDISFKRNENDSDIRGSITNNIFVGEDFDLNDFDFVVIKDKNPNAPLSARQKKEPVLIEIVRPDNVAEFIKNQPPDKNIIIDPRNSGVLPNIVKDGIYRIEIPEPVTKKTYINAEIDTTIDKGAPKKLQPPKPFAKGSLPVHNINAGSRQGPFRNIKRPRPGAGPFYNPNNFGQNSRQGPFYYPHSPQDPGYVRPAPFYGPNNIGQGPFYNPQYPGYNGKGPIYGPNNLGQNDQSPFYNPQNLGYDRQRPIYGTNNLGQNAQDLSYNPQNVRYDRQRPIYSTNNLGQNGQASHYSPPHRQGPLHNLQNSPQDIESPPDNVAPEDLIHLAMPEAPKEQIAEEVLGIEPPPVSPPHVEISTTTFAPGEGPEKDDVPIDFDEPTTGPITPFVRQMKEDMAELQVGYFSTFMIKLFGLVAKMEDQFVHKLLVQAQWEVEALTEGEHFLEQFGEPFVSTIESLVVKMEETPVDVAKGSASMLHYMMVNRRDGLTKDINSVINYIDSLYEEHEGVELFRVAKDIKDYPHSELSCNKLYRKFTKALFQPVRRLSGSTEKQILFDSLNKVIENHTKSPTGVLERRKGNFDKTFKFHYTKYVGHKSKEAHNTLYEQSTKGPLLESSPKNAYKKKNIARTKLNIAGMNSLKKLKGLKPKDKKQKMYTTNNNKGLNSKTNYVRNLISEMNKTAYFIPPLSDTTIKNYRFTIKDKSSYQPANANPENKIIFAQNNTQNDKIDKPEKYISKSKETNIVRNDTSEDEEETEERGIEISETGATNFDPLKISSNSEVKDEEKKSKHNRKKHVHFHKKEIRYLRHRHPKLYKIYLKYLKKRIYGKNYKKKNHKHKKKSRHNNKKKRNKKVRDIERHDHLLRHHMLKRTHLKARLNDSVKDISTLRVKNESKELPYIYDSFRSIEMEMSKDINDNVMTPNFAFITPFNNYIRQRLNYESTPKWVHYPIEQKTLRVSNQDFQIPKYGVSNNFANNNSMEFSGSMQVWNVNPKKGEIKQSSSYSDDEYELKLKLFDAMRHDNFYFNPQRRSINVTEDKNKLNAFSSYSSEEVVLKSNIYKALEFNKYHSRANFSDIVKKDSGKNSKKVARRSRFKPVNEMTSYSDDEEVILKNKLKL